MILRKHIELIEKDKDTITDRMENLHKFYTRHFDKAEVEAVWDNCNEEGEY